MTSISRKTLPGWLIALGATGLASELIYWLVFVRHFSLGRYILQVPPVDYAKLTGHSVSGVIAFALGVVSLFALYAWLLRYLGSMVEDTPSRRRGAWVAVFAGASIFGLTLIPAYPTAAIDVLIYAVRTHGWALFGLNPLATAPQEVPTEMLLGLAAEWSDAPSPYGTVWEGLSLLAFHLVGGQFLAHVVSLKAIALIFHLGSAAMVGLIMQRVAPRLALLGAAAFAWNPVALLESAGNGHNDIVMVFFLLLAVFLTTAERWRWLVFPALALAVSTKFVPILVIPFFWLFLVRQPATWSKRLSAGVLHPLLGLGVGIVLMTPIWPGWQQWAVRNLGQGAGRSPFALLVLILRNWMPTSTAFDASQILLGGIFGLIYLWTIWKSVTGSLNLKSMVLVSSYTVFFWYLVLPNQQFHAWYLLWPLAFAALLVPSPLFLRIVLLELTAWLAIPLYETLRVWWWGTLTPLVVHLIAVPFVFGLPYIASTAFGSFPDVRTLIPSEDVQGDDYG